MLIYLFRERNQASPLKLLYCEQANPQPQPQNQQPIVIVYLLFYT